MKNLILSSRSDHSLEATFENLKDEAKYICTSKAYSKFGNQNVYLASEKCIVCLNGKRLIWSQPIDKEESTSLTGLHFCDINRKVYASFSNGSIFTYSEMDGVVEEEAAIGACITSMAWSPDDEIVLLATDLNMIVALTQGMDKIDDIEVNQEGFGDQEFINVGWGKKETQFQGKRGKIVKGK